MQAVIFDMDGVLIDSEPIHERIERELFDGLGITLTTAEHRRYQGTGSLEMWRSIIEEHALDAKAGSLSDRQRSRFLSYLKGGHVPRIPGILELLAHLRSRRVPLAVASSSVGPIVRSVLRHTGLEEFFGVVVSGDEVARSKPAPDIFLLAAERLGLHPRGCLVVEDSENGVAAARAAGMVCVGFRNPGSGSPALAGADYRVESTRELAAALTEALSLP
ncbi:MAG: HAD family hydrolase [Spirochaetota bacterium]